MLKKETPSCSGVKTDSILRIYTVNQTDLFNITCFCVLRLCLRKENVVLKHTENLRMAPGPGG